MGYSYSIRCTKCARWLDIPCELNATIVGLLSTQESAEQEGDESHVDESFASMFEGDELLRTWIQERCPQLPA